MTKKSKVIIIIAVFIVLAIFAYALQSILKTPSNQQALNPTLTQTSKTTLIDPSKVIWNAKTTIPGTEVTFSYPKEGFYKQGIKLTNNQWSSDLFSFKEIESLYLMSLPEGIDSQQTAVRVFELNDIVNLESILKKLSDEGGMPLQGRYQEINGTRYFLQSSNLTSGQPEVYAYTAYAIIKKKLLVVDIQGGVDGSEKDSTPSFVTQFLSHLDFTCDSDCSTNSAPIINAYRGEQ